MAWVYRTYECGFGHRWEKLVERGDAPPECPICEAITRELGSHTIPVPRSDLKSPALRGARTKAVQKFEDIAFKKPHFDNGAPLLTNLKDNTRIGEAAAMPATPQNNIVAKIAAEGAKTQQWGWQSANGFGGTPISAEDQRAAVMPLGRQ